MFTLSRVHKIFIYSLQTQMGMFGGMPPMPNMMPPYNFQRGPPYPPYQMVSTVNYSTRLWIYSFCTNPLLNLPHEQEQEKYISKCCISFKF